MEIIKQFIETYLPQAQLVELATGFPAVLLLSQAALETGWGRYVKGNNLFGIKDLSWIEGSQEFYTHEFIGGKKIMIKDKFENFDSPIEAMMTLIALLRNSPRYREAYKAAMARQYDKYFEELQKAGYATDPKYAEKLKWICNKILEVLEGEK